MPSPSLTRANRPTGWLIALLPLALFAWFLAAAGPIAAGAPLAVSWVWITTLGVDLTFYVDGLSLVFALLITGIGALVTFYAGGYLAGHAHLAATILAAIEAHKLLRSARAR